jgi:hypothetical protein
MTSRRSMRNSVGDFVSIQTGVLMQIVPINILPAAPMEVVLLPGHPFPHWSHNYDLSTGASQPAASAVPHRCRRPDTALSRRRAGCLETSACRPKTHLEYHRRQSGLTPNTAEFSLFCSASRQCRASVAHNAVCEGR